MSREGSSQSTLNTHNEPRESGIWAEIKCDDSPYTVHGPNYFQCHIDMESQKKIENPRYNLDYGLDYPYHYVPEIPEKQEKSSPEFVKFRSSPPLRPPIPTSEIPHSRNMTFLDNVIDFLFDYWKHLLVGFGVLMVLLAAFLVLFFVVWKPEEKRTTVEPSTTTTEAPSPFCPLSFNFINDKCWKFINQPNTTQEAQSICETLGAHLVTLKNSTENVSLANFTGTNSSLWIGLQCCGNEVNVCRWDDNTAQYLNGTSDKYPFSENNPNWLNGKCVYYANGTWTSDECDMDKLPFVCEMAKLQPTEIHQGPGKKYPDYCRNSEDQQVTATGGTGTPTLGDVTSTAGPVIGGSGTPTPGVVTSTAIITLGN